LEREQLEKEAKRESQAAVEENQRRKRRSGNDGINDRRREIDDDGQGVSYNYYADGANNGGHINLFPEAKEAELRLARGENKGSNTIAKNDTSGVLPIPLGGDEATKRKAGSVPFYMRHTTTTAAAGNNKDGGIRYDNTNNSFRLGNTRRGPAGAGRTTAAADEITTQIMKDQFAKREDYRKDRMDPMCRFYVDKPCTSRGGVYANEETMQPVRGPTCPSRDENRDGMDKQMRKRCTDNDNGVIRNKKHHSKHKKKKKRRKRARKSYSSEESSDDDSSNMSSTSSSSFSSDERYTRKKKSRRRKKRRKESKSRRRRRDYIDNATNDHGNSQQQQQQQQIDVNDELRKKRHEREMKERDKIIMQKRGDDDGATSTISSSIAVVGEIDRYQRIKRRGGERM
jgi:hypothetical protein